VATAAFVASRVTPTGGFAVALAGGVALARTAQRAGLRLGWAAALAATLQAIAVMGPARVGVPLTQAVSAPVLGRMETRGSSSLAQWLVAAAVRVTHNVVSTVVYVWIILGLDAYVGSYDNLLGRLLFFLPEGATGALVATAVGLVWWTIVASGLQVFIYRRGLRRWPAETEPEPPDPPGAVTAHAPRGRFDPRAIVLAALVAFALLLATTEWPLLAAVSAWLVLATVLARGDRSAIRPGLVLAAILAGGALIFGLLGGLPIEVTLRRTLRAALLVLVAVWMRYAAGEAGLREVFRRALHRLRRVPGVRETSGILDGLGTTGALAASGRRLLGRLQGVPADPLPIADAVLDWVVREAGRRPPDVPPRGAALRAGGRDGALVLLVAAAGLTLPLAAG